MRIKKGKKDMNNENNIPNTNEPVNTSEPNNNQQIDKTFYENELNKLKQNITDLEG